MFIVSGDKQLLLAVTMFPAIEKHLSELTDVAGIPKYFFAKATIFMDILMHVSSTILVRQNQITLIDSKGIHHRL